MINVSDVATGLLGLGVIAGAVCLVALGGRKDDGHTVDDYRPSDMHPWLAARVAPAPYYEPSVEDFGPIVHPALDVLPPAPAGADAGSPLYVETLFRTWYPESPAHAAARMLREIAAEQRDEDDVIWNSTADRDLTGAFPVVAVAR